MTPSVDIEPICQRAYEETRTFYGGISDRCGQLGYELLYSPPISRPDMLLIGYQPGGDAKSPEEARALYPLPERWPDTSVYITAAWPLARNLRNMFGADLLARSVGLNAIFIRSPRIASYGTIDQELRDQIWHFCRPRVLHIIDAINPSKVVVMGLATLGLFGASRPDLRNRKGRVLTRTGIVGGRRALAMLHPTGARVSEEDRLAIAKRVLDFY